MASQPKLTPLPVNQQPHDSPYCSDPECKHCEELRAVQESIRLLESAATETDHSVF